MTSNAAVDLIEYSDNFVDELIPMWRASFEEGVGVTDPHPLSDQRQYFFDEVLPKNQVRLAVRGDRLLGFVAASDEAVAQLYVRIGYQRQGIGRAMLDWAKHRSKGSLWLYTFECNSGACAFYEKNGFIVTARGFEEHWQLADVRYEWSATPNVLPH